MVNEQAVRILLECILLPTVKQMNLAHFNSSEYKGVRGPALGSKFCQFHAVFGKFWQNHMFFRPLEG